MKNVKEQLKAYGLELRIDLKNGYGIEGKARVTEFIRSQSKEGLDSYPTFVTVE